MKIQDYLDKLGWSQKDFGIRLGVSKNTVSNWCLKEKQPKVVLEYLRMKLLFKGECER